MMPGGVTKRLPSRQLLLRLIDYVPETGEFRWKPRLPIDFQRRAAKAEAAAAAWNRRYAGKLTATRIIKSRDHCSGRRLGMFGTEYQANRIAWKMIWGEEPEQVAPKNGDAADCRLSNLCASARIYAQKTDTIRVDNTSGVRGVTWDKQYDRWQASIYVNGRTHYLGRYTTLDRAASARRAAEARFDFRPKDKSSPASQPGLAQPAS